MLRQQFKLPAGTIAYVGDKAYKNSWFMPSNLASYSVVKTIESTPEQVAAGLRSSYNIFLFVQAGATRTEIETALDQFDNPDELDWESFRNYYGTVGPGEVPPPVGETGAPPEELFPFGAFEPEEPPADVFGELGGEQQFTPPSEEPEFEPPPRLSLWDQLEQQIAKVGTAFGATARAIRDYFGY